MGRATNSVGVNTLFPPDDEVRNPIVKGYFIKWAWDGTKPGVTLLKTVSDITQDWSPAK